MKDRTLWFGVVVIIIAFLGLIIYQRARPGQYNTLAQCLTEKGVKMYGAYWCPHCQQQKEEFGNSFKKITYIECALPGGQGGGQTAQCDAAGIEGYPTWIFPDGSRATTVQTPQTLAEKVGCPTEPDA